MPIPTGGAWPPPAFAPAYASYRDWDAWYAGDADRLRNVYRNRSVDGSNSIRPSERVRAGQYAGGVVGVVSRWIWGSPSPAGQRDSRIHVPLPADISAAKAGLLFSEPPKLVHPNAQTQQRLEQMEEDGLWQMMLGAADGNSALGDAYLRPIIDLEVSPRAFLATVHADGAIPIIRWGRLIEVTFWQQMAVDGSKVWRLLEHHDVVDGAGRIVYALHQGGPNDLGEQVPFAALPGTAYLAGDDYPDGIQLTGLDRLDVVRIPNGGPQRLWRTEPALKHFGRSDYDGVEPFFDRADETWTSWLTDLKLAKGRVIVPDYMLQSHGAGQGATWNADQEIFRGMNMLPNQVGANGGITSVQFEIRWEAHKATLDEIFNTAFRHVGLSSQTLGEQGGDVAMTATESQSRERLSFTTRGTQIPVYSEAIAEASELLMLVEVANGIGNMPPGRPSVQFADGVTEAPEVVARTIQLLDAAGAVSTWTKVAMQHPDWTPEEVQVEVDRIKGDQQSITVTNPDTFTGADNEGQADDADELEPVAAGA